MELKLVHSWRILRNDTDLYCDLKSRAIKQSVQRLIFSVKHGFLPSKVSNTNSKGRRCILFPHVGNNQRSRYKLQHWSYKSDAKYFCVALIKGSTLCIQVVQGQAIYAQQYVSNAYICNFCLGQWERSNLRIMSANNLRMIVQSKNSQILFWIHFQYYTLYVSVNGTMARHRLNVA